MIISLLGSACGLTVNSRRRRLTAQLSSGRQGQLLAGSGHPGSHGSYRPEADKPLGTQLRSSGDDLCLNQRLERHLKFEDRAAVFSGRDM